MTTKGLTRSLHHPLQLAQPWDQTCTLTCALFYVFLSVFVSVRCVGSESLVTRIGVIAKSESKTSLDNQVLQNSTEINNVRVQITWDFVNYSEPYLLLRAVHGLKQQNVSFVMLMGDRMETRYIEQIYGTSLSLSVINLGNSSPSQSPLSRDQSSSCPVQPISTQAGGPCDYQPGSLDVCGHGAIPAMSFLGQTLFSVLSCLQWESVLIIFDKSTETTVDQGIEALSRQGVIFRMFKIMETMTSQDFDQIWKFIDDHNKHTMNITLLGGLETTERVLESVHDYIQQNMVMTSLTHLTRWLILHTTSSLAAEMVRNFTQHIDNVLLVDLPVETGDIYIVNDVIKTAVQNVDANNSNEDNITTQIYTNIKQQVDKCQWTNIQTLAWSKVGAGSGRTRCWQEVAKMDHRGTISVTSTEFFPNIKYGFNGRKLKVATLELFFHCKTILTDDETISGLRFSLPSLPQWVNFVSRGDNGTVSGLCFDLLEYLAHGMNFTYEIVVPQNEVWGDDEEGNWTGLVRLLIDKEVDLVAAPLAVQSNREKVIDFTPDFYIDQSLFVYKSQAPSKTKWRTLMEPFDDSVLICIGMVLPVASLLLFLFERFSPFYQDLGMDGGDRSGLHTYQDAFWYMYGALLTQGGEHLPRSVTGRTFLSFWWIFSIITMATYSGNLIAFMMLNTVKMPFKDIEGMVSQSTYKWGTLGKSVYTEVFRDSNVPEFQKIWSGLVKFNESAPWVISTEVDDHRKHLEEGNYAFIGDVTQINKWREGNCNLKLSEERFLPLKYAFALPNNSPFTRLYTDEMLKVFASGLLQIWKTRHWPRQEACSEDSRIVTNRAITIEDVQSAFYLVLIGIFLATIVCLYEKVKHKRYVKKRLKTTQ